MLFWQEQWILKRREVKQCLIHASVEFGIGKEQTVARLQRLGNVISGSKLLVENDSMNEDWLHARSEDTGGSGWTDTTDRETIG